MLYRQIKISFSTPVKKEEDVVLYFNLPLCHDDRERLDLGPCPHDTSMLRIFVGSKYPHEPRCPKLLVATVGGKVEPGVDCLVEQWKNIDVMLGFSKLPGQHEVFARWVLASSAFKKRKSVVDDAYLRVLKCPRQTAPAPDDDVVFTGATTLEERNARGFSSANPDLVFID